MFCVFVKKILLNIGLILLNMLFFSFSNNLHHPEACVILLRKLKTKRK